MKTIILHDGTKFYTDKKVLFCSSGIMFSTLEGEFKTVPYSDIDELF